MSGSSSVSTRFLIISDTHDFEFGDDASGLLQLPLPKVDVVLHCGDLTHCGGSSSYKKALRMLGAIDAELKLVIAGNHDLDLDESYRNTHLDEDDEPEDHAHAIEIMTGPLAAEAGVTYLAEGIYTFTLNNGASFTLYASPYSPDFCDWAFAYGHIQDRYNESHQVANGITSIAYHPIPDHPNIDIVMTHGPPKGLLDRCSQGNVGCPNLLQAVRRSRPRMHCFEHIHEGNGMQIVDWDDDDNNNNNNNKGGLSTSSNLAHRGQEQQPPSQTQSQFPNTYPEPARLPSLTHGQQSLMVNAAIMNAKNEPANAPWLLEVDLSPACRA